MEDAENILLYHPNAVSFWISAKMNQGEVGLQLQEQKVFFFQGGKELKSNSDDVVTDCCLTQGWKYIMNRRDGVGIKKLRFNGLLLGKADTLQETQGDVKLGIAQEWQLMWNSSSKKY